MNAPIRRIALAGNPNCGKTTLFNALTGLRQKVGNYPGVTVEKKVGRLFGHHGEEMELLDLPGTYSLQNRSPDEKISCDILLGRRDDTPRPDVIVAVIDSTNLERNLYLLAQIVEMHVPLVVALNMVDLAESKGIHLDIAAMKDALGVEVVPMVATKRVGLIELKQAITRAAAMHAAAKPVSQKNESDPAAAATLPPHFDHERIAAAVLARSAPMPPVIEAEMEILRGLLCARGRVETARAEALLLISGAEHADPALDKAAEESRKRIRDAGLDPVHDPVEARYAWAQAIVEKSMRHEDAHALTWSDRLDVILTHRVWGWIVFVSVLTLMFVSIFTVAQYPMDWIDAGVSALGQKMGALLPDGDFRSLVKDGVISGVGSVLVFLPQILILFFFIGLLEDTGYMARAAFIMDRLMSKVGLHGKSFIPLLSSFACAIPGIMATRTIENYKDRLVTIFVAPFMSCSARLPVYALLIAVIFPPGQVSVWAKAGIMLVMYAIGIVAAFGSAWLFKKTLLKGETPMLLLELPPYRMPVLKTVLINMWQRSRMFLRRAGTVILALSVVLWALATYPKNPNPDASPSETLGYSAIGHIGHAMEPLVKPLGYDWKIGIGLVSSFAAREVFAGTMAIIHNVEYEKKKLSPKLIESIRAEAWPDGRPVFTPLVCVGLMVFYVLALQCMSTVAIVRRETNSWRWPLFQIAYMTGMAYLAAFLVYQGGRLLGF